jgi:hypothetical protein
MGDSADLILEALLGGSQSRRRAVRRAQSADDGDGPCPTREKYHAQKFITSTMKQPLNLNLDRRALCRQSDGVRN